jgi:hypothetical protein
MYHAGYMTVNPMWFMVDYCSAIPAFSAVKNKKGDRFKAERGNE